MSGIEIFISIAALIVGSVLGWFIRHQILTRQVATIRQRYEELKGVQATQQHEISSLRQKLLKSEHDNGASEEVQDELRQWQDRARKFEGDLKGVQEKLRKFEKLNETLTMQNSELESLTGELRSRIDLLVEQENGYKAEISQLKGRLSKLQRHTAMLESRVKSGPNTPEIREISTDKFKQKNAKKASTDKLKQREPDKSSQSPPPSPPLPVRTQESAPPGMAEEKPRPEKSRQAPQIPEKPPSSSRSQRRSSQKSTTKFAARPAQKPNLPESETARHAKADKKDKGAKPRKSKNSEVSSTGIRMLEAFADEIRGKKNSDKSG